MDVNHRNISNADFKQDDFIKEMGMSRTLLTDKLKELTGFTPISLILEVRLKTAYNTIMEATDKLRVSDIAYSVGFNDAKYFSTCFRKRYGITPKDLMSQRMESVSDKKEN
jgi:AraC-like DNA-binding protein